MTIEEYQEKYPEWDIHKVDVLKFATPDDKKEAIANVKYVLKKYPEYKVLSIVMRSYYCDTMEWE